VSADTMTFGFITLTLYMRYSNYTAEPISSFRIILPFEHIFSKLNNF
jgi:hypothetical protein